jgi:hypothetical protein
MRKFLLAMHLVYGLPIRDFQENKISLKPADKKAEAAEDGIGLAETRKRGS